MGDKKRMSQEQIVQLEQGQIKKAKLKKNQN